MENPIFLEIWKKNLGGRGQTNGQNYYHSQCYLVITSEYHEELSYKNFMHDSLIGYDFIRKYTQNRKVVKNL